MKDLQELIIEKEIIELHVSLSLEAEFYGGIFLFPESNIVVCEKLRKFYNEYTIYFPFRLPTGKVMFLKRNRVAYFKFADSRLSGDNESSEFQSLITLKKKAEITFFNGSSLQGTVIKDKMEKHNRLSDCLNRTPDLIHFETEQDTYLISNHFIHWIEEI